jgi:uncharacterized LabA/DUF88 family protein
MYHYHYIFMLQKDRKTFVPPKNTNDMTRVLAREIEKQKVGIYIDAANLYHAAQIAKLHINFVQIYTWLKTKCKLKNAKFYTAYDPEDPKQLEFLNELEKTGYSIVKKPLKIFENTKKGNMDIEIAVDSILDQHTYDVLILVSGDGDFGYLVQALDRLGKKIIILGVGGFTSYELHQEADNYYFFNRIREVWKAQKQSKTVGEEVVLPTEKLIKISKKSDSTSKNASKPITLPEQIQSKKDIKPISQNSQKKKQKPYKKPNHPKKSDVGFEDFIALN